MELDKWTNGQPLPDKIWLMNICYAEDDGTGESDYWWSDTPDNQPDTVGYVKASIFQEQLAGLQRRLAEARAVIVELEQIAVKERGYCPLCGGRRKKPDYPSFDISVDHIESCKIAALREINLR